MIEIQEFYNVLKNGNVKFFTGVPDTLLNDFCLFIQDNVPSEQHVIAANEGNAIALAAGYYLSTASIPLVYMQNSGLGNAVNPLVSLTNKDVYSIPMILLVGWRGDPEIQDHPQHKKQGEITLQLLTLLNIPYKIISNDQRETIEAARWAIHEAKVLSSPVALVVKRGVLAKREKDIIVQDSTNLMSREEAIEKIIDLVPLDSIFIATTGRATRELYAIRERREMSHQNDFLNVGAMGHASSIATGIALGNKNRLVVCLDGDAALIMHMGSLTTAGKLKLPNLLHVVLNNEVHESVGGQPSAGGTADLNAIAESAGYFIGRVVDNSEDLANFLRVILHMKRPHFIEIKVRRGIRKEIPGLSLQYQLEKTKFMDNF